MAGKKKPKREVETVIVNGVEVQLPKGFPLITVVELAESRLLPANERTGKPVSKWSIYDRLENGHFPEAVLHRMGRKVLFRRGPLIDWLEGRLKAEDPAA